MGTEGGGRKKGGLAPGFSLGCLEDPPLRDVGRVKGRRAWGPSCTYEVEASERHRCSNTGKVAALVCLDDAYTCVIQPSGVNQRRVQPSLNWPAACFFYE